MSRPKDKSAESTRLDAASDNSESRVASRQERAIETAGLEFPGRLTAAMFNGARGDDRSSDSQMDALIELAQGPMLVTAMVIADAKGVDVLRELWCATAAEVRRGFMAQDKEMIKHLVRHLIAASDVPRRDGRGTIRVIVGYRYRAIASQMN